MECHHVRADTSDFLKHIPPINTKHRQAHKYGSFGGSYTPTEHLGAHTHTHKEMEKQRQRDKEREKMAETEKETISTQNPEQKIPLKSC